MPERSSLDAYLWKVPLVAGCLWILYLSLNVVLLALVSIILAAAILPLADSLQKRRVPRAVTVLGIYAIGLGILTILVILLVPVVSEQAHILAERLPQFRLTVNQWIASGRAGLGRFTGGRPIELPTLGFEQIGPLAQGLIERSLQATRGLFTATLAGLLVLFVAGYIVIDRRRLAKGLLDFVPRPRRERVADVATDVLRRMGGYIRGQVIVSACAGLILTIGLALVGFETPLLIGVVAGALNFVPYLGSTVTVILAVLLSLNSSVFTIAGVVVVFVIEQMLEANFLVPYFTGRQVELHPLAVLGALIVGANLAGVLGALVAVPLTAGIDSILQDIYVRPIERRQSG
jgi:predicted PurR-regulated permease PerM